MNRLSFLSALVLPLFCGLLSVRAEEPAPPQTCYEMRTYHAADGKLADLETRFRDHTTGLFTKHGMTNVGYWVPVENPDNLLIYVLSYPDKAAREVSWKAFMGDPDWKAAAKASEVNGKLVTKVDSRFLTLTDFSPAPSPAADKSDRVWELRTYTTTEGHLTNLLSRFRDHTVALFAKHGMTNFAYWTPSAGDPGADNTLVYLLAHDSKEARDKSFDAFRSDPDWVAAKEASEKAAGGSLTIPDGVVSVLLTPTDFSPAK